MIDTENNNIGNKAKSKGGNNESSRKGGNVNGIGKENVMNRKDMDVAEVWEKVAGSEKMNTKVQNGNNDNCDTTTDDNVDRAGHDEIVVENGNEAIGSGDKDIGSVSMEKQGTWVLILKAMWVFLAPNTKTYASIVKNEETKIEKALFYVYFS